MAEDRTAYFRRKSAEAGGAGGFREATPEAPVVPSTEGRSFGFRSGSGAGAGGSIEAQHYAAAERNAASLGEPTSFRGGAGAPEPIGVIRRMTQTFVPGRLPGDQFLGGEYPTPEQAKQAWNRGMGSKFIETHPTRTNLTYPAGTSSEEQATAKYGGFRAPGTSLAETVGEQHRLTQAAENKRPEAVMKAKVDEYNWQQAQKTKVGTDFESRALKRWGTYKDGKPARPAEEHVLRDLDEAKEYAMEQGNPQAGHNYMEWSQRLREMYPDVYATTMKTNPLAWRDVVISHGPNLPAPTTGFRAPAPAMTEPEKVFTGQSPWVVGP